MELKTLLHSTLTQLTLIKSDDLQHGFTKLDKAERSSAVAKIMVVIAMSNREDFDTFKKANNLDKTFVSRATRCEGVIKEIEYNSNYEPTEFSQSQLFEMVDFDECELTDYLINGTITPSTTVKELRELKKVVDTVSCDVATEEVEEDATVVDTANEHVEITNKYPKDIVIPYELFINMYNNLADSAPKTIEKASKFVINL